MNVYVNLACLFFVSCLVVSSCICKLFCLSPRYKKPRLSNSVQSIRATLRWLLSALGESQWWQTESGQPCMLIYMHPVFLLALYLFLRVICNRKLFITSRVVSAFPNYFQCNWGPRRNRGQQLRTPSEHWFQQEAAWSACICLSVAFC